MPKSRKVLMIVESPNKEHTIQGFFRNPVSVNGELAEIRVVGQVGHDMRLADSGLYNVGVDFDNKFTPDFIIDEKKRDVVKKIKTLAKATLDDGGYIVLAEDADIEGELLAMEQIRILKLKPTDYVRVTYNEITPSIILNALNHPRKIDMNRVDSAEARTILDKIVGFRLSPMSHKWIGARSVGRVQSATLKIITDREKEILAFVPTKYCNVYLNFRKGNDTYKAQYKGEGENGKGADIKDIATADKIIADCGHGTFFAKGSYHKTRTVKSPLPYTTSTFQVEAASKLGISPKRVMSIAEDLFSKAKITYIRTDSSTMSDEFAEKLADFVKQHYGEDHFQAVKTAKADKLVQGAHECIRVVSLDETPEGFASTCDDPMTNHIYELIYNHTVASSMKDCVMEDTVYPIYSTTHRFEYVSHYMKFDGFRKVIPPTNDDVAEDPQFTENEKVDDTPPLIRDDKETSPKKRFTEATLAGEMNDLKIGRPSTTASIIAILEDESRNYNTLQGRCLCPTKMGMTLSDWLARSFPDIINLTYTKDMEEKLDDMADGKIDKLSFLSAFYKQLCDDITKVSGTPQEKEKSMATENVCPKCGKHLKLCHGKFGTFLACEDRGCGYTVSCDENGTPKPKPAPEYAKDAQGNVLKCPKCGEPLIYRTSKRGTRYITCSKFCGFVEFQDKTTGEWAVPAERPEGKGGKPYYKKSTYNK